MSSICLLVIHLFSIADYEAAVVAAYALAGEVVDDILGSLRLHGADGSGVAEAELDAVGTAHGAHGQIGLVIAQRGAGVDAEMHFFVGRLRSVEHVVLARAASLGYGRALEEVAGVARGGGAADGEAHGALRALHDDGGAGSHYGAFRNLRQRDGAALYGAGIIDVHVLGHLQRQVHAHRSPARLGRDGEVVGVLDVPWIRNTNRYLTCAK